MIYHFCKKVLVTIKICHIIIQMKMRMKMMKKKKTQMKMKKKKATLEKKMMKMRK